MKTEVNLTLNAASHSRENFSQWLSFQNSFLSALLGCPISNLAALCGVLFNLLAFASFILLLDAVAAYGWSAFCGLLALNALLPLVREFKKGGK